MHNLPQREVQTDAQLPPVERDQVALNRAIEDKWRRGEITFAAFDWWLRTMCGV